MLFQLNVRKLVQNEQGMVLMLTTLVKMGYQVSFQVLQAGHNGVIQSGPRVCEEHIHR